MRTFALSTLFLLAFSVAGPMWAAQGEGNAGAQSKMPPNAAPAEPAQQAKGQESAPKLSVTEHSVTVDGKVLKYKATAGYLVLKDEEEKPGAGDHDGKADASKDNLKPKARIFFVAYTLEGSDSAKRPVTFAFNGGPGAASVWLHIGALGPRIVKMGPGGDGSLPPYQLVDNPSTWLADTDLVFIDPVSTGYSRPVPGESAKAFHDFHDDLQSVAETIRLYTTENNRWLSPKFIIGESYGGTRAAAIVRLLQQHFDFYINGVVIVSGLLNWQTIDFQQGNDIGYPLFLPAYTDAAWIHQKLPPDLQHQSLDEVRKQAETFAMNDYLLALAKGSSLTDPERTNIANQLSRFTGLPVETILRYNLRITPGFYMDELLKAEHRSIGRFDSRLTGIAYDPDGADFDPSFATMRGNFTAAIYSYLRSELKFETELPYRSLADVSPWNFNAENRYLNVSEDLGKAMCQSPNMKVWFVAGYYDLAISYFSTDYALKHLRLDPTIQQNLRFTKYPTGHMPYTEPSHLKQFREDFETFLKSALP